MKKIVTAINKPIVLIATLLTAFAVVLAKFFMTKDEEDDKK